MEAEMRSLRMAKWLQEPSRDLFCPLVCREIGFHKCAFGSSSKCHRNGIRVFLRGLFKYLRVGYSKRFLLLRGWCFGLRRKCVRTLLAALRCGIAGRVSGLMSSRVGRAHRDCLPLFTAPKQSHCACFAVLRGPSFAARWCVCLCSDYGSAEFHCRPRVRFTIYPRSKAGFFQERIKRRFWALR